MVMCIVAFSEGKKWEGTRGPGTLEFIICEFKWQRDRRGNESSECANK